MISGEDISQWIKEPLKASQAPSNELKELTEKYPYASSLHILYLKNLADKNDLKFESTLKKVASNVMDREQLYQIIKAADVQTTVDEKQEVQHPEELKEVEPIKTILPAEKEVIVEEESTGIKAENASLQNTESEDHSDSKAEDVDLPKIAPKEVDHSTVEIKADQASDTAIESSPEPEPSEISTAAAKTDESSDQNSELRSKVEDKHSTIDAQDDKMVVKDPNLSFVAWLKMKKQAEKQSKSVKKEEASSPKANKKQKKSTDISALLDKFIAEEPSISRPTKDFYNPSLNARNSVEEVSDIVSETLAKIHVIQKNYRKAIHAYEQLILLYPEKKTFFASQIEKIKKEIQ